MSTEVIPSLFDTRLYRQLSIDGKLKELHGEYNAFYPFYDYTSYVYDWHTTPGSLDMQIAEAEKNTEDKDAIKGLQAKKKAVEEFATANAKEYLGARSLVHPYALVKIAGASGNEQTMKKQLLFDNYQHRRFYEIDGGNDYAGHYAKNPTTTALIKWGNESDRNKTPYSFQDFVFCKWWNKIENNRMITLRRYASPVTDNIEFPDYETSEQAVSEGDKGGQGGNLTYKDKDGNVVKTVGGTYSKKPWTPLATAVTYFGKDTGNDLSKILKFSAKYNWKEIKAESSPIEVSSTQNEAGAGLVNDSVSGVSSGLGVIARVFGVLGDIQDGKTLNMDAAVGVPEDPYTHGPYMNRILGPINVIMNTYRRERGLEFKQDGLILNFEYIARPISGINNKAIIMDLLANILVLGYSSGSWFGGMWKYHCDKPAMYPWKYGDVMNKLHRGQIFGKNGAIDSLGRNLFSDGKGLVETFIPDVTNLLRGLWNGAVNSVKALFMPKDERSDDEKRQAAQDAAKEGFAMAAGTGTAKTIQKLIAAKITRGTSVPYLRGQRALLTGEPVGDWHLTIGNPFNPIAMIGNLVVKDLSIEFYDELGPDDFPIGFKATITLAHGLGRDRDAIESMFNRGFGRIYTLSSDFRSSADGETKVDGYTGSIEPRNQYDEIRMTYYGGGTRGIMKKQEGPLQNAGSIYAGDVRNIKSLAANSDYNGKFSIASYYINPWQMSTNL